jgi:hypothetical protein
MLRLFAAAGWRHGAGDGWRPVDSTWYTPAAVARAVVAFIVQALRRLGG